MKVFALIFAFVAINCSAQSFDYAQFNGTYKIVSMTPAPSGVFPTCEIVVKGDATQSTVSSSPSVSVPSGEYCPQFTIDDINQSGLGQDSCLAGGPITSGEVVGTGSQITAVSKEYNSLFCVPTTVKITSTETLVLDGDTLTYTDIGVPDPNNDNFAWVFKRIP